MVSIDADSDLDSADLAHRVSIDADSDLDSGDLALLAGIDGSADVAFPEESDSERSVDLSLTAGATAQPDCATLLDSEPSDASDACGHET